MKVINFSCTREDVTEEMIQQLVDGYFSDPNSDQDPEEVWVGNDELEVLLWSPEDPLDYVKFMPAKMLGTIYYDRENSVSSDKFICGNFGLV